MMCLYESSRRGKKCLPSLTSFFDECGLPAPPADTDAHRREYDMKRLLKRLRSSAELLEDMQCPICMRLSGSESTFLMCHEGHHACFECITSHIAISAHSQRQTCPMCKGPMSITALPPMMRKTFDHIIPERIMSKCAKDPFLQEYKKISQMRTWTILTRSMFAHGVGTRQASEKGDMYSSFYLFSLMRSMYPSEQQMGEIVNNICAYDEFMDNMLTFI